MWNYFDKKRGWSVMGTEYDELQKMFWEEIHYAQTRKIWPENVDNVGFYLRSSVKTVASCSWHKYTDGMVDIGFAFNAEVVKKIPLAKLRETVIHEVAHACSIGDGHGFKWKKMYCMLGERWGYDNPTRLEKDAAINAVVREYKTSKAKYLVRCPACGTTWKYTRATACVQRPQAFRCGCGWKGLELVNA